MNIPLSVSQESIKLKANNLKWNLRKNYPQHNQSV